MKSGKEIQLLVFVGVVFLVFSVCFVLFFGYLGILLTIILALVLLVVSALSGLTIVEEGTAKAVMRFNGFKKFIMAWKDHTLSKDREDVEDWQVLDEPGAISASGLRWIGFWPISTVYHYGFRWRDIELVQGKEVVQSHDKKRIDYILVKPDVYWTNIIKAETKAPEERIPLDVEFLVTVRVVNPYKALFAAPSNWNENVMSRLNAMLRAWVATKKLDELLSLKRKAGKGNIELWKEVGADPLIVELERDWGIRIIENGIEIRDIGLGKEYQEAAAAEQKMKLEAKGVVAGTTGALMESLASLTGTKVEEIQKEFKDNPDAAFQKYKKLIEENGDYIKRDMSLRRGARIDIGVQGATGVEQALLNIIGAWQRMPGGKGMPGQRSDAITGPKEGEQEKKKDSRLDWLEKVAKEGLPPRKNGE